MAVDPRRFPAHLRIHVALIAVVLLLGAGTAVQRRTATSTRTLVLRSPTEAVAATTTSGPPADAPRPPSSDLDSELVAAGHPVPPGAEVYAVRVREGPHGLAYDEHAAGRGALVEGFWPASSIKVLAALGALDLARSLGFSGEALVTFDDGNVSSTLRSIYEAAIRDSSNFDYDLLLMIAGIDRLNGDFLTAAHGFPATVITRSYAETDVANPPGMTLSENGRSAHIPPLRATYPQSPPECPAGNCSNLFELSESVRRIVLNDQIPPDQRFNLAASDLKALKAALLAADGFFPPAVSEVFGPAARIYDKPGDTADGDCLDVAFIDAAGRGRYLLAASVPHDDGGCEALTGLAGAVLRLLAG